jgi:hypothetical protein
MPAPGILIRITASAPQSKTEVGQPTTHRIAKLVTSVTEARLNIDIRIVARIRVKL